MKSCELGERVTHVHRSCLLPILNHIRIDNLFCPWWSNNLRVHTDWEHKDAWLKQRQVNYNCHLLIQYQYTLEDTCTCTCSIY